MTTGPIHVLDEIVLKPGQRAAFLAALRQKYQPTAEKIGLRLRSLWLDPALESAGVECRALLDWELGQESDFWSWRGRGGAHPELVAFWREASAQIARRTRRYVRDVAGLASPAGEAARAAATSDSGRARPVAGLRRQICLVHLRAGTGKAERAALEEALTAEAGRAKEVAISSLGRNFPDTLNGGDYTWDLLLAPAAPPATRAAGELVARLPASLRELVAELDDVELETPLAGGLRQPGLAGGTAVKRTLLLRTLPGAAPEAAAEFERDLLLMPAFIPAIRNWSLARVRAQSSRRGWTHAWEQDFADLSGLNADYMNAPVHWSLVDGWFHPEDPRCIVSTHLAHVFCSATRSILSDAFTPGSAP